nr:hypothetical protein [Bacilli bacterium]
LIGILLESNYDKLLALLSDENKYNELKEFLEKYKVIGWQNSFYKIMDKCDIAFSEGTIASLISNFDIIKERLDKTNNKSLTSIIDYANSYSKGHGLYKTLFGTEDFRLLDNNPGPNKASMSRRDRLAKCGGLIPKMYAKNTFTVPTVDEIITLDNGKQIRIIIGNSTNMMNLTYGERTGACMRKGGAYNDLFDFCLQNKNGFHVRFVNPETDNFVSRVSGMRNGNTLFLNELRNSVDPEYTDDDLYEASKKISKYLINISKTSSCPLDNVLVSVEYALKDHLADAQNIKLNLETRADALRHKPFDLGVTGILLANSTDDKTVLPYNFTDDVPEYESIRDEIRVYRDHDAINRIKQIRIINDLINGVPQDKIKLSYGDEIPDYVISGEDFYISYINDIPEVFILDSRKNNPRTIEEVKGIINSNFNEIKPNNRTQ